MIGDSVALRKAGKSLTGCCPFHREKTPSFHVDQAKQLYYCFGCGAGGDIFRFVMEIHGVDFVEAVGLLADRYGLPRPSAREGGDNGEDRRRRKIFSALEAAHGHFRALLETEDGSAARHYLAKRGIDEASARTFELGFSPSGWDGLIRALAPRGFDVQDLVDAGLAVPRRTGDGAYDRFRNRLVFPIRDPAGRIVSFGGRALGDDDPKYLNGSESPVYDKSRTLYRLSEVAREIRDAGRAIVVEGYFDAVSLARAGVRGVVAVCGTALGDGHAQVLRRWTDNVVLFLDGDDAGRRAVHRVLPALLKAGLGVRIASPPAGSDPDDLARESGAAGVERVLHAALDLPAFLVDESRRLHDIATLDGRVKAAEMSLSHLSRLESAIARSVAARRVADGLGIDDALFCEELERAARRRESEVRPRIAAAAQRPTSTLAPAERTLLRFLGGDEAPSGEEIERILTHIPPGSLSRVASPLIERWSAAYGRGARWNLRDLADAAEPEARVLILELAFSSEPEPTVRDAVASVDALRSGNLKLRLAELQRRLETTTDPEQLHELMLEKVSLAKEYQAVASRHPEPGR